ncbi:MAG: hypothetical protein ACLGHA_04920 [Gammaproteobacteria bacterium]
MSHYSWFDKAWGDGRHALHSNQQVDSQNHSLSALKNKRQNRIFLNGWLARLKSSIGLSAFQGGAQSRGYPLRPDRNFSAASRLDTLH